MENQLITEHQSKGRYFEAGGIKGFAVEEGKGEPILCLHGVPASSFLYRKIITGLAQHGFKGLSLDFPGMGLSDRPEQFDYSWTGLGKWCTEAVEALPLDKYHLIIHDIGGPVGCELIANHKDRILSVTILNAPIANLSSFTKPFPMFFFEKKGIGEVFLSTTTPMSFMYLMRMRGVHKNEAHGINEARAYIRLLKGKDKGRAFLKIMRNFEATLEKEQFYIQTLKELEVPMQIIWGINDKGLTLEKYGTPLQEAVGIDKLVKVSGSHFLQEDYAAEVVHEVVNLIGKHNEA